MIDDEVLQSLGRRWRNRIYFDSACGVTWSELSNCPKGKIWFDLDDQEFHSTGMDATVFTRAVDVLTMLSEA